MSGIIVPVLRKTDFVYSHVSTTQEIIIANALNLAPFRSIGLNARVHARTLSAACSFQFILRGVDPSAEDGQDFSAVPGTEIGTSSTVVTATPVPSLLTIGMVSDPAFAFVRVILKVTGTTGTIRIYGQFSADLLLREG